MQKSFTIPQYNPPNRGSVPAPHSPCSVGSRDSDDESVSPNGAKEKRANGLYKSALRYFKTNDFAESISLLKKSIFLHPTANAKSLLSMAVQGLEDAAESRSTLGLLQNSCPVFDPHSMGFEDSKDTAPSVLNNASMSDDVLDSLKGRSFPNKVVAMQRSHSLTFAEGFRKAPPKLKRAKSQAMARLGGSFKKSYSMSPRQMFGRQDRISNANLDRKRLRRSTEYFDFGKMVETLDDETNGSSRGPEPEVPGMHSRTSSGWQSVHSSVSSVSGSSICESEVADLDYERTNTYSPDMIERHRKRVEFSMPIVSTSPKCLPSGRTPPKSPKDSLILTEEQNYCSPHTLMGGGAGDEPDLPEYTESPIRKMSVGKRLAQEQKVGISSVPFAGFSNTAGEFMAKENYNSSNFSSDTRPRFPTIGKKKSKGRPMPVATPTREQLQNSWDEFTVMDHIRVCKEAGVRMMALDFDNTFVNIHTSGTWKLAPCALKPYVRPVFLALVPAAIKEGIIISIVTFSAQIHVIKELLESTFEDKVQLGQNVFICGPQGAAAIAGEPDTKMTDASPLRSKCSTPISTFQAQCAVSSPSNWFSPTRFGKRDHIKDVCAQYHKACNGLDVVDPCQVLLIDDDNKNIKLARQQRVKAVWFQANEGANSSEHRLLKDLMRRNW